MTWIFHVSLRLCKHFYFLSFSFLLYVIPTWALRSYLSIYLWAIMTTKPTSTHIENIGEPNNQSSPTLWSLWQEHQKKQFSYNSYNNKMTWTRQEHESNFQTMSSLQILWIDKVYRCHSETFLNWAPIMIQWGSKKNNIKTHV